MLHIQITQGDEKSTSSYTCLSMLGIDLLKLKAKLITIGIPGDGQTTCD